MWPRESELCFSADHRVDAFSGEMHLFSVKAIFTLRSMRCNKYKWSESEAGTIGKEEQCH